MAITKQSRPGGSSRTTCSGLVRYRTRPLTGVNRPNPEGYKPSHQWHPIYRKRGESYEDLWTRMDSDLLDVDLFPDDIDGVHVIAAVQGFLVTLDPKGLWPVLHPYSPNSELSQPDIR